MEVKKILIYKQSLPSIKTELLVGSFLNAKFFGFSEVKTVSLEAFAAAFFCLRERNKHLFSTGKRTTGLFLFSFKKSSSFENFTFIVS